MFKTGFVVFFFQWINILINMSTYTPPQCFLKRDDCLHVFKCKCNSTFFTKMRPKTLVGSVLMSNVSLPSPSMMLYFISALSPTSLSFAHIRPTTEPTGADSGMLIWYSPKKRKKEPRDVTFLFLCPLGGAKLLLLLPVDFHYFRCSQI